MFSSTRVLSIGAHPDDIELGCGGTMTLLAADGVPTAMLVLTDGAAGSLVGVSRRNEQRHSAELLGSSLHWGGLKDSELSSGRSTIAVIEAIVATFKPTVVFAHSVHDSHQDHEAAARAALAACRNVPSVLHFQAPSSLMFQPTVFSDVSKTWKTKIAALQCHASQMGRVARVGPDAAEVRMASWGLEARCGYAEAFEATRLLLSDMALVRPRARSGKQFNS